MASPGAGKTSLSFKPLVDCLKAFAWVSLRAILLPTIDSDKIMAVGMPVVQINTGGECHLDANRRVGN